MIPYGLMFHHFHGGRHKPDSHGSLSAKGFELVLRSVGIHNIISPEEWLFRVESKSLRGTHVCITFDDALRSQFDICLPVLEKYNLQGFWFVYSAPFDGHYPPLDIFRRFRYQFYDTVDHYYSDFFGVVKLDLDLVFKSKPYKMFYHNYSHQFPFYSQNDISYRYIRDRLLDPLDYQAVVRDLINIKGVSISELCDGLWLNDDHLRVLHERGHVIGLHSYDHPTNMSGLTEQEQREQYNKNYEHIARICEKPKSMSHPCNSYNDTTIKVLKDLGISCGFRSNMYKPPEKVINASSLEMPREDSASLLKQASVQG